MRNKKVKTSITIDPALATAAHKIAIEERRSFSNLVSLLVEKYIQEKSSSAKQ